MTLDAKTFLRLKEDVENRKTRLARDRGRLEAALDRLREAHGCASLDAARKLLRQRRRDLSRLEDEYRRKLEGFEKVYDQLS